jgi:hypothetical protein
MRSGPTRSASGVELAMSQNSTVTCLCSPASAARVVRIRSARCLGVYAAGEAKSARGRRSRPHSRQNLAVSGRSVEQFGHRMPTVSQPGVARAGLHADQSRNDLSIQAAFSCCSSRPVRKSAVPTSR